MNKINLIGRLTRDPEVYSSKNGNINTKFTLAVDRRFAKEGYQQVDYVPISVWGKAAEFASMYFEKGIRVAISGRLELNNYKDQNTGQNKTFTQVTAEELFFADSKKKVSESEYADMDQSSFDMGDVNFD